MLCFNTEREFCFRTMMMIGNSEILNLRIRLGIYFVFNVGFSVSGGCLVKVVNNAASVTRLNLSLRLHATIFKASRRAALPQLAFFAALARASESESECASARGMGEQRAGHDLPLRPGYYVICGQQLSAARARKIDDVVGEAPAPEKPPPLSRSARFSECSAVGQFGNGNYVRHKTDIGHLVRSHPRLIVILDAVSPAQLSPRFSCFFQPPTGHPLHSRCHNIRSFQLIYTGKQVIYLGILRNKAKLV